MPRTGTEGKWFWEKDGIHCGAVRFFPAPGATYVAVCDLPEGHEGSHTGEIAGGGRETWDDRQADESNRHQYREMVKAFTDDEVELPFEDGI